MRMSEQPPAGWYPDGHGNERYWDGAAWTDTVRVPSTPPTGPADATKKKDGVFAKLGATVKQTVADRQAAKDEAARQHAANEAAAGALVTRGVFGTSTIEVFQGGYVRVAEGSEDHTAVEGITKKTPYEKLRSIKFTPSDEEKAAAAPASALEGAVGSAVTSLMKGGKNLMKGTVPGLAVAGIAHVTSTGSRRSFLTIATDKTIHTLSNQSSNGFIKTSNKGHSEVARELEAAGNAVLGIPDADAHQVTVVPEPTVPNTSAAPGPSLSERLRELADLHKDGILSDEEFAASKAKLLAGL